MANGAGIEVDAVDTVIRMSVDYGLSIGLESKPLLGVLLLTQFVFPAAVVVGRLGERRLGSTGFRLHPAHAGTEGTELIPCPWASV